MERKMTKSKQLNVAIVAVFTLAMFLMSTVIGASGAVKYPYKTEVLAYEDYFGDEPISMSLVPVLIDIVYTTRSLGFTETFDDTDDNTWTYGETGAVIASNSVAYTDSEAVFTAKGDGTNATTSYYNHTATATNGLRKNSGTIVSARFDLGTGTPQAYLRLLDASAGTYLGVGYDESGNIVYDNNGTPATIVATGSVDAYHYSMEVTAPSTGSWTVKVYNSSSVQKGTTVTLTPTLTYANYDKVQLFVASTSATAETAYTDCVWGTTIVSDTALAYDEESHVDWAEAPVTDYEFGIEMSYIEAGITNDSSKSETRTDWGYNYENSDYSTKSSLNSTEFLEYMACTSERANNEEVIEQDMYAMGFDDVEEEVLASVEDELSKYEGQAVTVVDYILADLIATYTVDDGMEENIDDFYDKDVPEILIEAGATVTLTDGTVMTADLVPAEAWRAYFGDALGFKFGKSLKKLRFPSASDAKKVMEKLSKAQAKKISAGMGMAQCSVGNLMDKSSSSVKKAMGNANDKLAGMKRTAVSAPTNFMVASVKASKGAMKNFEGGVNSVASKVQSSVGDLSARVQGRVTTTATGIKNSISSAISGTKNTIVNGMSSVGSGLKNGVKFAKDKAFSAFSFVPKMIKTIFKYIMYGALAIVIGVAAYGIVFKREEMTEWIGDKNPF